MTTRESIEIIRDYLSMNDEGYYNTEFIDGDAILGPMLLFHYDYDDGGMTLYDLDFDEIAGLNMDEMIKIFPELKDKAICSNCKGTKKTPADNGPGGTGFIKCECEGVVYPI